MQGRKIILALGLAVIAVPPGRAQTSTAPAPLNLDALLLVESHGSVGPGDHGRSLGPFQFGHAAWSDVNRSRVVSRMGPQPYALSLDPKVSREFAAAYLQILAARLRVKLGRPPSGAEIFCAWNCGVRGFGKHGFQVTNCPASTLRALQRLNL